MAQSSIQQPVARVPFVIRFPGPIMRRLLRLGIPLGPNGLVTVRGRISGELRTQPLAVAEYEGHSYVVGLFGDVNWCRNLRAANSAEIELRGRLLQVRPVELSEDQATEFFRDLLPAYLRGMPLFWRLVVTILIRAAAPEVFSHPKEAARSRPVFELRSAAPAAVDLGAQGTQLFGH